MPNFKFEESYALAGSNEEKSKLLETLIAGSPDYYYYNCLHLLNVGAFKDNAANKTKFDKLMSDWSSDHHRYDSTLYELIKNRSTLLGFEPAKANQTFTEIKNNLGISFHYSKQYYADDSSNNDSYVSTYSTSLNKDDIDTDILIKRALKDYPSGLNRFDSKAYPYLANNYKLESPQLKQVLQNLSYPLLEKPVDLLVQSSTSFDSFRMYQQLTLEQLGQLAKEKKEVVDTKYAQLYLSKLLPSKDAVDYQSDRQQLESYLKRAWEFVQTLPESLNSFRLNVLYHYLNFQITYNIYDQDLFMKFIKLPRTSYYYNTDHNLTTPNTIGRFNEYINMILTSIDQSMDEKLIKTFLERIFLKENDFKSYGQWLRTSFLQPIFAEVKLLANNSGADMDKWYQLVSSHSVVQQLKDRVDIEFVQHNPSYFHPDDNVEIQCNIKNVSHLLVKVFQVSTYNFYKDQSKQIDSDINLDGLVANQEYSFSYTEPPIQRVLRTFTFPDLKFKRGCFVLEFIGNGKSSRALIRKGELNYISAVSQVGQVIRVLDEDNVKISKAAVYIDGNRYSSDQETGDITVPFSSSQQSKSIILIGDDGFASLKENFQHFDETYTLVGGIFIDDASCLQGERLPIVVRARLYLKHTQISLSNLEESVLTITTTDNSEQSIVTVKEVKPFVLSDKEESVYNFNVPENVKNIKVAFNAKVKNLSQGGVQQDLAFQSQLPIGSINETQYFTNCYLRKTKQSGYQIYLLGKGGEPIPNKQLSISLKHWMFSDYISVLLQTDKFGIITLGELLDIETVIIYSDQTYTFNIKKNQTNFPTVIHSKVGDQITIPIASQLNIKKVDKSTFGLFELISGSVSHDHTSKITYDTNHGQLAISPLPPGEHILLMNYPQASITIQVCDGEIREGFIIGNSRVLSYHHNLVKGLNFTTTIDKSNLKINLSNYTSNIRLHLLNSYFVPLSMNNGLAVGNTPVLSQEFRKSKSNYFNGRELGDEITYILNRKLTKNELPGNSLKKPSLLIQPWSVAKTKTNKESLSKGGKYKESENRAYAASRASPITRAEYSSSSYSPFLEFLQNPSVLLLNLQPNQAGEIVVPLDQIMPNGSGGRFLTIVAVDNTNVLTRELELEDPTTPYLPFKDTRLIRSLDKEKHYTEKKLITTVSENTEFTIFNADSAEFAVYDTLAKVFSLSKTLTPSHGPIGAQLQDFGFLSQWNTLTVDQKKEKFSKFYCHELAFFIKKKDQEFFNQVVLPFVKCKMHKTFVDFYLIDDRKQLSTYIWSSLKFKSLNTFEKVLLAEVFPVHARTIQSFINEQVLFTPLTAIQYDKYFKSALSLDMDKGKGDGQDDTDEDFEENDDSTYVEEEKAMDYSYSEKKKKSVHRGHGDTGGSSNMDYLMAPVQSAPAPMMMMSRMSAAPAPPPGAMGFAMASAGPPPPASYGEAELSRRERKAPAMLYKEVEKTEEWAETYYYKRQYPTSADLIQPNEFWNDYINWLIQKQSNQGPKSFLSKYITLIANNFTSIVCGISLLDLPFQTTDREVRKRDGKLTFKPTTPIIVFHQELVEAKLEHDPNILVSQHYFDPSNRYNYDNGEQNEIYVSDEFIASKVYGCLVVLANFSSKQKKIDVLLQIPKNAVPIGPSPFYTRGKSVELYAYSTNKIEFYFYFPQTSIGKNPHFPAHVSEKNRVIVAVQPTIMNVVAKPTIVNQLSWDYIAANSTNQQILDHLEKENIHRIGLDKIYYKLTEVEFWKRLIDLLRKKGIYDSTVWSFTLYHQDIAHCHDYMGEVHYEVGKSIQSPLLNIDPIIRGDFQYLEYSPLINSRTHQLGSERKILNEKLDQQYKEFIAQLSFKAEPSDTELLSLVYYLLAQDRFNEAVDVMKRVGNQVNQPDDHPMVDSPATTSPSIAGSSSTSSSSLTEKEDKKRKKELEREEKRKEKEEKKKKKEEEKELAKKKKEEEKALKKLKKQKQDGSSASAPSTTTSAPTTTTTTTTTVSAHVDDGDDAEDIIDVLSFNRPSGDALEIQYDYLISYLDFFNATPTKAQEMAEKYKGHPVLRWNSLFKDLHNKLQQDQVVEIQDSDQDRERRHAKMVNSEPSFDISLESDRTITVNYANLKDITVSYYIMDIELLFSTNPFVQQKLGQFLYISPNKKESFPFQSPADQKNGTFHIKIPVEYQNSNILVDCESAGIHQNLTVYSNSLAVQITEKVGQLRVVHKQTRKPISKCYVKVYQKSKNSDKDVYWKDGYTDNSGYFDYSSVSTGDITDVSKFSILVLHNQYGALIKEASPPGI